MQRKSKTVASKKPCAKVSAKSCMTKGVKAKKNGMTAKNVAVKNTATKNKAVKNTPATAVFVAGHVRVLGATKALAKAAAKAKPAARPAKRTVKRKK
jgi:hypothetical protein